MKLWPRREPEEEQLSTRALLKLILKTLVRNGERMSALSDAIANISADVTDISGKVSAVLAALASGQVTQTEIDALTAADAGLKSIATTLGAALPAPAPAPAPAPPATPAA